MKNQPVPSAAGLLAGSSTSTQSCLAISSARLLPLLLLLFALAGGLAPPSARGGNGRINADGTIDIGVNFRWPPTADQLTTVRDHLTAASRIIWDATEGQLRFGRVTFSYGSVNEDEADIWIDPRDFRAVVSFWSDGSSLGTRGDHINLSLPGITADLVRFPIGTIIAHEFGHLAFGLGDEYNEQRRFGACWGYGPCIEAGALTEQNQCLMQQSAGVSQSEFCTAGQHDLILGDGLSCATRAVPHGCTMNCEFFKHSTGRYETTQQSDMHAGRSCWQQLVLNVRGRVPTLGAPAALPTAAAPAGFSAPTFDDGAGATDTVMLILDRSDSMNWNTESDFGEVCGNGVDDDGDTDIDETTDCTQPRLAFVKAAARAWLALANNRGVNAGIMSFNHGVTYDRTFRAVNDMTLPDLQAAVDGLFATGFTAIGDALRESISHFPATGVNKTAFLISDGVNTDGEDPSTVVPDVRAAGIRVFSISTGGASDDSTLSEVAGGTRGARVDSRSATTLVNAFAEQWARYRNITTIEPRKPYRTDQTESNSVTLFNIEANTPRLTLLLAGNLSDMSRFGVRAILSGPPGIYFDTEVAHPALRVVRDSFFVLAEVEAPAPGPWRIQLYASPGAPVLQTGHLTLLSEQPDTELFTSLDRHVITDTSVPVELRVVPIHRTTLYELDSLVAQVTRPDGGVVPMPISASFGSDGQGTYSTLIADMPLSGLYQVRVKMRTGPATYNDPGESLWASSPSASVAIPIVERVSTEYFFVPRTPVQGCIEIQCPESIVRTTCSNSIPVSYSVWASNRCNPASLWTWCTPPSGSPFSLGETRVDCWAIGSGETNQCSFTVTVVRDPNCPPPNNCLEIHCPANIVRSTCSNSVPVFYSVWATNHCKPTDLWTWCTPPSGSSFSLGETPVDCWATGSVETNKCSFTVTVVRAANCPPTNCIEIRCPQNIVKTTCSNSIPVAYSYWASNRCSPPNLMTWCNPPSPSFFSLGETRVDCWAVGSGQTNQCSFTVTVLRDENCGDNCTSNLLANGSFENPGVPDGYVYLPGGDGSIFGWVTLLNGVEYYNPGVAPLFVNTGAAADGGYLLDLASDKIGGGIQQTFPTVVGRSYRVSFAMGTSKERGRDGSASLTVSVAGAAHSFNMTTDSSSIAWERKSFSFVARSTSTTLIFTSMDEPELSFVNLDDVRVSDCCEDSTLRITPTVTVEWECGILQSAPEVTGPWVDVPGATSPYTTPLSGERRFFRARL